MLWELHLRNLDHVIWSIFETLEPADVWSCRRVSRRWRAALYRAVLSRWTPAERDRYLWTTGEGEVALVAADQELTGDATTESGSGHQESPVSYRYLSGPPCVLLECRQRGGDPQSKLADTGPGSVQEIALTAFTVDGAGDGAIEKTVLRLGSGEKLGRHPLEERAGKDDWQHFLLMAKAAEDRRATSGMNKLYSVVCDGGTIDVRTISSCDGSLDPVAAIPVPAKYRQTGGWLPLAIAATDNFLMVKHPTFAGKDGPGSADEPGGGHLYHLVVYDLDSGAEVWSASSEGRGRYFHGTLVPGGRAIVAYVGDDNAMHLKSVDLTTGVESVRVKQYGRNPYLSTLHISGPGLPASGSVVAPAVMGYGSCASKRGTLFAYDAARGDFISAGPPMVLDYGGSWRAPAKVHAEFVLAGGSLLFTLDGSVTVRDLRSRPPWRHEGVMAMGYRARVPWRLLAPPTSESATLALPPGTRLREVLTPSATGRLRWRESATAIFVELGAAGERRVRTGRARQIYALTVRAPEEEDMELDL